MTKQQEQACCAVAVSVSVSVSDSPWSDVVPVPIQAPLLDHVQQRHRELGRGGWGHPRGALHVHTGLQQAASHQPINRNIISQAINANIFSNDVPGMYVEAGQKEQEETCCTTAVSPCGKTQCTRGPEPTERETTPIHARTRRNLKGCGLFNSWYTR